MMPDPQNYRQEPSIWIFDDQMQWAVVSGPFAGSGDQEGWEAACDHFVNKLERIPGYRYKIE